MFKYKVQMINRYSGEIEDACVEDEIFDSESAAEELANYMRSCSAVGAEILKRMNPFDYEEDYGHNEDYEYIVVEIE